MQDKEAGDGTVAMGAAAGSKAPELVRVIAVYDNDSGQVIHRRDVLARPGAEIPDDRALMEESLGYVAEFYGRLEKQPEIGKLIAKKGLKLCPVEQLTATVIKDVSQAVPGFRIDPKSGQPAKSID